MHYVPLLSQQRAIYAIPAGRERFDAYVTLIREENLTSLSAMNPMGKPHCATWLDDYITQEADAHLAREVNSTAPKLPGLLPSARVTAVLIDDLKGGWTNRWCVEYDLNFPASNLSINFSSTFSTTSSYEWLLIPLWTSEPAELKRALENTRLTLYRRAYQVMHPPTQKIHRTLREHLAQEAWVRQQAANTKQTLPVLSHEEHEYTYDVLKPLLENTDRPTILASLYGDEAATSLGYKPLGLSPRAGLMIAPYFFTVEPLS